MKLVSPEYRVKVGTLLIVWAVIVSTISGIFETVSVEQGIVKTVFITGAGLISGGLLPKMFNKGDQQ